MSPLACRALPVFAIGEPFYPKGAYALSTGSERSEFRKDRVLAIPETLMNNNDR
jgi:hypothetical protein